MISPWYLGQTHPAWALTLTNGVSPIDLTNATITARLCLEGGSSANGEGVAVVTNSPLGQFTYASSADDFPAVGVYAIQFKAVYEDGSFLYTDPFTINVVAPL